MITETRKWKWQLDFSTLMMVSFIQQTRQRLRLIMRLLYITFWYKINIQWIIATHMIVKKKKLTTFSVVLYFFDIFNFSAPKSFLIEHTWCNGSWLGTFALCKDVWLWHLAFIAIIHKSDCSRNCSQGNLHSCL